ncbi:MAG: hypothetical protein ABI880_08000 [Acidobacteriota bacterium]
MDVGIRSPLVDAFRRVDVPKDVRMDAAAGLVAPRGQEQLALFAMLIDDPDPDVCAMAERTLASLPPAAVGQILARTDTPADLLRFFAARGIAPAATASEEDLPLIDAAPEEAWPTAEDGAAEDAPDQSLTQRIQQMGIVERVRAAMKGSREARTMLIRDPNKMVSSAVLSSPKLTIAEVESFAKMANVGDDVLRAIGQNRAWVKSYGVAHGLIRNPKTPVTMSMNLLQRLVERDVRSLSVDRNVPEPLRLAARKRLVKNTTG